MEEDPKLQKLQEVVDFFDKTHLTTDDFIKSFQMVIDIVENIKTGNEKEFELIHGAIEVLKQKMKDEVATDLTETKDKVVQYCIAEMNKMLSGHRSEISGLDAKLEKLVSQRISDEVRVLETIRSEIPKLPEIETTEAIRDRLTDLPEGEKLPVVAIEGLEKRLGETEGRIGRIQTPAKAFRIYTKDATAQCNGVTKTFTVGGSHFGIIGVYGTQFPLIYRPVIDYTETRTGILMTSEVSAPETSQTLVILYLK